jgi:hypothetical protein
MFENITVQQLKRAVAIKEQIENLERELSGILGASGSNGATAGSQGRRTMSAAARARIAAAQKRRWAKTNRATTPAVPKKGRRRMSAAARAKIAAAAKARWAKAKAQGKKAL